MTIEERKPTGLLHSADELKQLIAENPDLVRLLNLYQADLLD